MPIPASIDIDPLEESLDYTPELMRAATNSPTAAVFSPFSNMVPVKSNWGATTQVKEEPVKSEEPWDEDLTNFEFKVPPISSSSPDSLVSQYSPLRLETDNPMPVMRLNLRHTPPRISGVEASTPPHRVKQEPKEEPKSGSDCTESVKSLSSDSKGQSSDYSEPPKKVQRKRGTRKRKATPQSRRLRQENNKRAAARYRAKRKNYVNELEQKVENLTQALDRKETEVAKLQNKNSALSKQIDFFKNLLGKNPGAKAQFAMQMFVCVVAVALGVVVTTGADHGMPMSHHRTLLSVDTGYESCIWSAPLWAQSVWGTGCLDLSALVSTLRILVHLVVVPLIVWVNFTGFEEKKAARHSGTLTVVA